MKRPDARFAEAVSLKNGWTALIFVSSLSLYGGTAAAGENIHCSSDQTTEIAAANLEVAALLKASQDELRSIRDGADSTRFEYWFGAVTEEKLSYLDDLLYVIFAQAVPEAGYVCGLSAFCDGLTVYAWTEHGSALNDPPNYGVYVCDLWFQAAPADKVATLVHEYSHLYGTGDLTEPDQMGSATWEEAAHKYALNHPDSAVTSAYNVQFFVEGK